MQLLKTIPKNQIQTPKSHLNPRIDQTKDPTDYINHFSCDNLICEFQLLPILNDLA